jgi:hypothetical protein
MFMVWTVCAFFNFRRTSNAQIRPDYSRCLLQDRIKDVRLVYAWRLLALWVDYILTKANGYVERNELATSPL